MRSRGWLLKILATTALFTNVPNASVDGFNVRSALRFSSNRARRQSCPPGRLRSTRPSVMLSNETLAAADDIISTKPDAKIRKKKVAPQICVVPIHWINDTDTFIFEQQQEPREVIDNNPTSATSPYQVHFTVRGQPLALKRHRSSRGGFLYNPSAKQQQSFCDAVKTLFPNCTAPIFPLDDYLAISMVFIMKRPKNHYIGNRVEAERLRPTAPLFVKTLPDVDNLAKFVLDSLNDLLFHDDRQVVSLQLTKVYGDDPATRITVQKLGSQGHLLFGAGSTIAMMDPPSSIPDA